VGYLPRIEISGLEDPVVQVVEERSGEVVYTIRVKGASFHPQVFTEGTYILVVGDPDLGKEKRFAGLRPVKAKEEAPTLEVTF